MQQTYNADNIIRTKNSGGIRVKHHITHYELKRHQTLKQFGPRSGPRFCFFVASSIFSFLVIFVVLKYNTIIE